MIARSATRFIFATWPPTGSCFDALRHLLRQLHFTERVRGSHHLFSHPGIPDLVNLQRDGPLAKVYQVRQVRALLRRHRLASGEE